jgi:hypothetical protein
MRAPGGRDSTQRPPDDERQGPFGDVTRTRGFLGDLAPIPRSAVLAVERDDPPSGSNRAGAAPNRVQIALPVHDAME